MEEKKSTVIYFCNTIIGNADVVDIPDVATYAKSLSNVSQVWLDENIALTDTDSVARKINVNNFGRIVIAGNNPGMCKSFFSKAMVLSGNMADDVVLANFMEHGALYKTDTDKAKAIVACAVANIPFEEASIPDENTVNCDTLVIGGGIAGIQASLEIAASKNKVYLVEKSGTIGGHMAMFDKTFPTLDCAACILTPKMVEVGQHPYIDLMTYSEVIEVRGVPGNYKVKF